MAILWWMLLGAAPAGVQEGDRPKGHLGIRFEPAESGIRVVEVITGSSADRAGLRSGDVIEQVGEVAIASGDSLVHEIESRREGDSVALSIVREETL